MWAQVSFVLPQSTRLTDRRTERPCNTVLAFHAVAR